MIKTFRFLLLAALTMVCGSIFAQDEATTVTWNASSGDALTTIYPDANISLVWEEGAGDFGAKYVNGSVYFYNGNRLTIAGRADDVKIQKIVFTYSSGTASLVTCNASGKNESTVGITNSTADMTTTWEGEASSLIFRASQRTGVRYINSIEVTYTGGTTGPVETAPVLSITTTLGDSYDMDANGVFVVYAKNEGDAAAGNAKLTVNVDGAENTTWEIGTLAIGEQKWNNTKFDVANIEAGEHTVTLTLTADNAEAVTVEKTVNFTKKAAEASYSITAQAVTVPYDAEDYSVVATLTNTSEVAGANVAVELRKGISDVLSSAEVVSIAAGAAEQVTLTVVKDLFETGQKTYYLYVNDKYLAPVSVTFEEAPVVETKSLEITSVDGTIKLGEESNSLRVIVQNTGNVDITDAAVVLKNGETTLGQGTVSATAGQQGWATISVDKTGLEAGTITVTAIVTLDDENTIEKTAEITVEAAPVAQATYSVTAEDVTVAYGAENFEVKAVVKNTSDVEAKNVVVKLTQNIQSVVEPVTIETLAAGAEQEVTFTVEGSFNAGTTARYYVQVGDEFVANKAQQEITVTFEAAPVEEVKDLAITEVVGTIDLANETNNVRVSVKNNGTVDINDAAVTLKAGEKVLGTATVSAAAEGTGYCMIAVASEGLEAGELAVVATVEVEGDATPDDNTMEATIKVVDSSIVEPQAEIALNPISGWEVEAGEQTVTVSVGVFNTGDVDAENVKIELYKNYNDGLCEPQTVNLKAGESTFVTFTFDYTFEQGKNYEFTVFTGFADADASNNMQQFTISCPAPVADVAVNRIADVNVTTEEDAVITATLKNNSDIVAENVLVALYQGTEQVEGMLTKVNEIAAGEEAEVSFNLGKLAAGTYSYNVMITTTDGNNNNNVQGVTVKVTEPVEQVTDLAITAIQGAIDLTAETNTLYVYVENKGTVDVNDVKVKLTVTGEEAELGEATFSVKAGKSALVPVTLITDGLEAGTLPVHAELVDFEDADMTNNVFETSFTVTDAAPAEATFTVVAEKVSVPFGAEYFEIMAVVKNVSEIDATNVEVKLLKGINEVATTTISELAGGAEQSVVFQIEPTDENPFVAGKTATYYVQVAGKAQAEVTVVFEEEAVDPVVELAIADILGSIDLTLENNYLTVSVENTGNVDIIDAKVVLTVGGEEAELGEATVSVKAGQSAIASVQINVEGLEEGTLPVHAEIFGEDETAPLATFDKEVTVTDAAPAEPTFAVTADDVTVEFGAESFEIKAVVTNTSDVDATDVEVKLLKGLEEAGYVRITKLAAGKEHTVTFDIDEIGEAGTTATYYVQVANQAQAEVTVTFAEEAVEDVIDLAVTSISGTLSLDVETNYVTVFVENQGNVDVTNARVALTAGNEALGEGTVSAKAGATGFCSIAVPATALTAGEFTVVATVTVDGDANEENNSLEKTYTIAAPTPELSFTVAEVVTTVGAESFPVEVTVTNSEKADAENVVVTIYDANGAELASATIDHLAAGTSETVTINVDKKYETAGTFRSELQVLVSGVSGVKWVGVTVNNITDGIAILKAQYGENVQVYTINGQKVDNVQKGLYIVNGRKVVIK
ncbi:MAG: hypothetical protein IJ144_03280 [Prevotella sp.]|nr:hypothetical protein [Prevotella sp.]